MSRTRLWQALSPTGAGAAIAGGVVGGVACARETLWPRRYTRMGRTASLWPRRLEERRLRQRLRSTAHLTAVLVGSSSAFCSRPGPDGNAASPLAASLWLGAIGSHAVHATYIPHYLRLKTFGLPTAFELPGGVLAYGALIARSTARSRQLATASEGYVLATIAGDLAYAYLAKGREHARYLPLLIVTSVGVGSFARSLAREGAREPAPIGR